MQALATGMKVFAEGGNQYQTRLNLAVPFIASAITTAAFPHIVASYDQINCNCKTMRGSTGGQGSLNKSVSLEPSITLTALSDYFRQLAEQIISGCCWNAELAGLYCYLVSPGYRSFGH